MWKLEFSCCRNTQMNEKIIEIKKCFCWNLVICCVFVYKIWLKIREKNIPSVLANRKETDLKKKKTFCIHMICDLSFISNKRTITHRMCIRINMDPFFCQRFIDSCSTFRTEILRFCKNENIVTAVTVVWASECVCVCDVVRCGVYVYVCMEGERESVCCVRERIFAFRSSVFFSFFFGCV